MSFQIANNSEVTLRHPIRTIAGDLKTGEEDNLTTALTDPNAASSSNTVTVSEIGTSGWYSISFTPDVVGNWVLTATNPAGTDESITEYVIQVFTGASPVTATSDNLTTLAVVKSYLYSGQTAPSTHDTLLASLIVHVSGEIIDKLGRSPAEATFTEYVDGEDQAVLYLRQGPLVSVTSIKEVAYSDGGSGSRTETLTTVDPYTYVPRGLRDNKHLGLAWVESLSGTFNKGIRNYQVVYTAGFATVPATLVQAATSRVVAEFFQRETHGLSSKAVGDGAQTVLSPTQQDAALTRAIAPYKAWALA